MEEITTRHYVIPSDIDHIGLLYSGRAAEWAIECAVMTAVRAMNMRPFVFLSMKDMVLKRPVFSGAIVSFKSRLSKTGKTSLTVDVSAEESCQEFLTASVIFVSVDENRNPVPHGISL